MTLLYGSCIQNPGRSPFELGLRQHALLAEQREQTPVEIGEGRERVRPATPADEPAATTTRVVDHG